MHIRSVKQCAPGCLSLRKKISETLTCFILCQHKVICDDAFSLPSVIISSIDVNVCYILKPFSASVLFGV